MKMKIQGTVRNGVVILDAPCPVAEGTLVEVEFEPGPEDSEPTWADVFKDIAGKATGLPSDYAENHDYYLHGQPKKSG
jgi:hypothetical protein